MSDVESVRVEIDVQFKGPSGGVLKRLQIVLDDCELLFEQLGGDLVPVPEQKNLRLVGPQKFVITGRAPE